MKFYPLVAQLEKGQLTITSEDGEEIRRLGPADSRGQAMALLAVYGYVSDDDADWQESGPVEWYGFLTYDDGTGVE